MPPLAPDLRDALGNPHQLAQGRGAEGDNDSGADQLDLTVQVSETGTGFIGRGCAVIRRAALHHIRDIGLLALHADGADHPVQQLPGLPYEGASLQVFISSGALPHEHEPGLGVPFTEDEFHAARSQGAGQAALNGLVEIGKAGGFGHDCAGWTADGVRGWNVDCKSWSNWLWR